MQRKRFLSDTNRVSRVGTTIEPNDHIECRTEQVDNLALTLVAPAEAEDTGMMLRGWHVQLLHSPLPSD